MTLEDWRRQEGLSYQALAERLQISSATHARRYALGKVEIPPEKKEEIIAWTGGAVTLEDLHRQRLAEACFRRRGRPICRPQLPGNAPHAEASDRSVA